VILSYLLTDEAYSVAILRFTNVGKNTSVNDSQNLQGRVSFYIGAGVGLWSTWQISTLAGIYIGEIIPASWSLDFALPLTLIALIVPAINTNSNAMAALAAGTAAVLLFWMPYYSGLIVASMVGIFTGMVIERRK
jgi:predicted branched-subunit amino acid permease